MLTGLVAFATPRSAFAWPGQAIQDGTAVSAEVVVDRPPGGKPHAGKVLAAIQPHCDDIPLFAAGAVIRLIDEGYTGHLIRVTNDDMAGPGSIGNTVLQNERDNQAVARALAETQVRGWGGSGLLVCGGEVRWLV